MDTTAAQDAYETAIEIGEQRQLEALSEAKALQASVSADDMTFEFAECAEDVVKALSAYDAGKIRLADLGLVLLNVRAAMLQRQCGVFAAPDAEGAIELAMRGEAV